MVREIEPFDDFDRFRFTEDRGWSGRETDMWERFNAYGITDDPVAQALFHEGFYNPGTHEGVDKLAIRDTLADYLRDEYGLDFDDVFDWEAWREMYGADQ